MGRWVSIWTVEGGHYFVYFGLCWLYRLGIFEIYVYHFVWDVLWVSEIVSGTCPPLLHFLPLSALFILHPNQLFLKDPQFLQFIWLYGLFWQNSLKFLYFEFRFKLYFSRHFHRSVAKIRVWFFAPRSVRFDHNRARNLLKGLIWTKIIGNWRFLQYFRFMRNRIFIHF